MTTKIYTEQENKNVTTPLTMQERLWNHQDINKTVDELFDKYDNFDTKREWVKYCFEVLVDMGITHYTAYKKIRYAMDREINVSDSYIRTILAKDFHVKLPRGALSEAADYLDFEKVRERYTRYVESGQKQLDIIKDNEWQRKYDLTLTQHQY